MTRALPLLLLLATPLVAADATLHLRVVGVHDGDTLTGLNDQKEQVKVRLDAIDAPELGQPFGRSSKKALSDKVFGKDVVVTVKTKKQIRPHRGSCARRQAGHQLGDARRGHGLALQEIRQEQAAKRSGRVSQSGQEGLVAGP